jgi:hypothetical protein
MSKVQMSSERTTDLLSGPDVAPEQVWSELEGASFAVLSYVTASGRPRSSGVLYGAAGERLYVTTAPDSWKARSLRTGDLVSVTVPIRRGGLLAFLAPIPPATVTFSATVTVHPPGTFDVGAVSNRLASLLPESRRTGLVLELAPHGSFLTYGINVSLKNMADPAKSKARVPVG